MHVQAFSSKDHKTGKIQATKFVPVFQKQVKKRFSISDLIKN